MIPKIIHYAWLGPTMPDYAKKRISEWKKELPDWRFMFWNENNYDFNKFEFTKQKISNQEWGYAADELRYDVLNKFGGFYLDTDMIIKKDLTPFLEKNLVMGFMYDNSLLTSFIGSESNNKILQNILKMYANTDFNDLKNNVTNNPLVTFYFLNHFNNFKLNGKTQELIPGHFIYSKDYFCYPSKNKKANYAEHLFDNAWNHGNAYKGIKGIVKRDLRKLAPVTYGKISNYRGKRYTKTLMSDVKREYQIATRI